MNKLINISLLALTLCVLASCAAGAATAATAGYALKSQSADSLTAEGEQRIIDRAKREFLNDMSIQN